MSDEVTESFKFQASEPVIRAFEKFAYDREFREFIKYLENRAVMLAIMSLSQKDDILNRWLAGRAGELLDIVAVFKERKSIRQTEEFLEGSPEDPFQGVDQ